MSELDTVGEFRQAFYRLVGSVSTDHALVAQGESVNGVADYYLTRGARRAQTWLLRNGYQGWRKRSSAITWLGSDSTTGGRYSDLPADFLRLYGDKHRSALTQANGDGWGTHILASEDRRLGNFYYVRDQQIWITRNANPPTNVFLTYHYRHPVFEDAVTLDFPEVLAVLVPPEAAKLAMSDNWLPGGGEMKSAIREALQDAREECRHHARQSKEPRRMKRRKVFGTHW